MGSGLKLLIAGMIFGVVAFFAFIGVTKTIKPNASPSTTQQTITLPNAQSETADVNSTADEALEISDNKANTDAVTSDAQQDTASDDGFEIVGENNNSDTEKDLLDPTNAVVEQDTDTSTDITQDITTTTDKTPPQNPTSTNTNQVDANEDSDTTEKMASLEVSTILASNKRPVNANIYVQKPNGQDVSHLNNTQSGTFSLPEGQYKITARFGEATSVRNISLNQDQTLTLTLSLEDPKKTPPEVSTGTMQIVLKALGSNTAIKGNVYIQLPNGRQVTNQNYIDKAEFTLDPGTYKVTAKAPGKADLVRNLTIIKGEAIRATFEMQTIEQTKTRPTQNRPETQLDSPSTPSEAIGSSDGTIHVSLQNTNERARFVVRDQQGEPVAQIRGVANTRFKLAPGIYNVIASQPRLFARKTITLAPKQTVNVTFNQDDFSPYQGGGFNRGRNNNNNPNPPTEDLNFDDINVIDFNAINNAPLNQRPINQRPPNARGGVGSLQLHAISGSDGRPLAVNFTVTTLQGAVLGNYNNVANINLSVPPQDVLVLINYETMQGQERITVRPDEPTTYTFTITPLE